MSNKKAMIMMNNVDVESASSIGEEMPPLEVDSDDEIKEAVHGNLLVIRCALNVQSEEDDDRYNMSISFILN